MQRKPGTGGLRRCTLNTTVPYASCAGGEANTTNNRMEMTAVIVALEALKEQCCNSHKRFKVRDRCPVPKAGRKMEGKRLAAFRQEKR